MKTRFRIRPVADTLSEEIQKKISTKTKPLGALGMLEEVAFKLCNIQQRLNPAIEHPHIVVFAGDHGIAATGLVNPYPQEVTAQMVLNFIHGGAAINVFCRQHGIQLTVVDAGVYADFDRSCPIVHAKIARGTKNYLHEAAMTIEECQRAIVQGSNIVEKIHKAGTNCIGFGEMGIGNSSAAALIMSAVLKIPVSECIGKGTGANESQLLCKKETLEKVVEKHRKNFTSPLEILRHVGGFEIAMMTGAYLRAASLNMIIIVDGFIATAALLLANEIDAHVLDYCLFAHCSNEQGHGRMLQHLRATPILSLDMRLGEGTGAALALPLIQSSAAFINEMASFESAGVSSK